MPHKIAFYMPRTPYLKVFGPVLDYLLTEEPNRFEPVVLIPRWTVYKPDQQVDPDFVRKLFGPGLRIVEMEARTDFGPALDREAVEAVICLTPAVHDLDPPEEEALLKETRAKGIKWVSLPGVLDEAILVARCPERVLTNWDLVCTLGPAAVKWMEHYVGLIAPELAPLVRSKVVPTGHPEFDGLKDMDPVKIRDQYGLPKTKPIIFLSTACASPGAMRKDLAGLVKRGLNVRFRGLEKPRPRDLAGLALSSVFPTVVPYRAYLAALRKLADRNGAVILAKSRTKHDDPAYVGDYVDYRFSEGSYYPFSTLQFMAASSLYFGFQSACSLEALVTGVYSINVMIGNLWSYADEKDTYCLIKDLFFMDRGYWNLEGYSQVMHGLKRDTQKELNNMSKKELSDFGYEPELSLKRVEELMSHSGRSSAVLMEYLINIL